MRSSELIGQLREPGTLSTLQVEGDNEMLVSEDGTKYEVFHGVPKLLEADATERLRLSGTVENEAVRYEHNIGYLDKSLEKSRHEIRSCLAHSNPRDSPYWIDSTYEYSAQSHAYNHLEPLEGAVVLQVGGAAPHALKQLTAGARLAFVVTPFLSEALAGATLAHEFGLEERFLAVVGMAERLPLASESFDRIYAGGSLHHLSMEYAGPELSRVLRPNGRFAAIDPFRTHIYDAGTRVFGKREKDINCVPLNAERLSILSSHFEMMEWTRFHPLARYPLILADRTQVMHRRRSTAISVLRAETWIEQHAPGWMQNHGSCVATLGTVAGNSALDR